MDTLINIPFYRFIRKLLILATLLTPIVFTYACGDDDDDESAGAGDEMNSGTLDASPGSWYGKGGSGGSSAAKATGTSGKALGSAGSMHAAGGAGGQTGNTTLPDGGVPPKDAGKDEDSGATAPQCETEKGTVLYLSADDSNSVASPVIVRKAINEGKEVFPYYIRTYEFTNYYDFKYQPPQRGTLNIVPQIRREQANSASGYVMQIGVQSHFEGLEETRPLALTFVVDSSGSMNGTPLELEKEVLRAIAVSLREGDIVSLTTWNTQSTVALNSHVVTGPNDKTLLDTVGRLTANGSTDLNSGLIKGYQLAASNFDRNKLNRVLLISDGQANVGITDEELIAKHADDAEDDAIYLIGVGCGNGYDDTLMDTVTDAGKGAYLFIDTKEEARKQFTGDRFVSNLAVAAMDVRVKVTLPPTFSIKEFHGEEYSTNPIKVKPQHLAPNDAMVFHQTITSCAPDRLTGNERVIAEVFFTDPATRARKSVISESAFGQLLTADHPQLLKGDAVVQYAEMFKKLPSLANTGARKDVCLSVQSQVRAANPEGVDPDLSEIDQLLEKHCARF
jgi:Ca-activated chloride channel family protein